MHAMKILPPNNGVVIRIEYYNPYPPDIGYFTFNGIGNTAEEVISELCRMKRINPAYIRDKCILCTIDCISTGLTDYLIHNYYDDYCRRRQNQKQNMDDYLKRNPSRPFNSVIKNDDKPIFSVL